ncbi:Dual specificity phosphatase, catalytic domain [Rhizoctonia solani]|uniref:Dual specificity phosphatase, catalytic domain n=1 Tax=Rhizoctonia solani TaxID=456999 RepID=A0A8H8NWP9_9AGAM|nr:Dual specificity phosphatase, catalytic domain [Rhizoctonia solani]QRW20253.1 Dual specificity phosphatase, catalytic domain [Rhizoctonia solani]
MKSLGITHVACIRDVKEAFSVKPRFPGELQYLVLDVEDNEEQNLIRLFPRIFDRAKAFIDNALQSGGRVLVHCNGGISLSPSFVIMYVMERFQLAWDDALQMIKEYESIYKAQRAIQSAPDASRPAPTRRKREDDDEEAEESDTRRRPEPTEMQQKDIDMT